MAAPLNSLFFVFTFTISFLPNYRVKYYDYIGKWCSGIKCIWCPGVSLDIALDILALSASLIRLAASLAVPVALTGDTTKNSVNNL